MSINKDNSGMRAEEYLAPRTLSQLAPFELRAKMIVEGIMSGMHRSPYQGLAVEFAQHRQYVPGDNIRHIDWKVFGRSDKLYLKQYQQETNLDVMILVDASSSMRFGTLSVKSGWGGTDPSRSNQMWTKFDHATATTVAIAHMCLQQRDRVGVATFSSELVNEIKQSSSRDQWRKIVQCLATEPVDGSTDLEKMSDQVLSKNTKRTLFIVISDFLVDPSTVRNSLARFKHRNNDVILLHVLDDLELTFDINDPSRFTGLEENIDINIDPRAIRSSYMEILDDHMRILEKTARNHGYDYQVMNSHESVGPVLGAVLAKRNALSGKSRVG